MTESGQQIEGRRTGRESTLGGRRTVLMLAFQFPPFSESTGGQRVVSFVRHLPALGWQPIVLTAAEHIYTDRDPHTTASVPSQTTVVRAQGWDTARELSLRGRYPRWLALPDRWVTWGMLACLKGMRTIRKHRPDVLWATFPVPSTLVAGLLLHRLSGLPLVVDLRDPIVYEHWPTDPTLRRIYGWIERQVVKCASRIVVTTPGARDVYLERYRELSLERIRLIPNGIDEEAATRAIQHETRTPCVTLLHSGLMEVPDRDPTALFIALARMRDAGRIRASEFRVVLRATGHDESFREQVRSLGLEEFVSFPGRLPRAEALLEMDAAHGLLLLQGSACNRQIPAKAYEYLARRRPIVGLCDPRGNTHDLLARQWGIPYMADMADPDAIALALNHFLDAARVGAEYVPPARLIPSHSRKASAVQLAELLDGVSSGCARSKWPGGRPVSQDRG